MTNSYDEPYSPGPLPLPCPTPHSAPVKWLKSEPPPSAVERPAADVPAIGFDDLPEIAAHLRSDPKAMAELIALVSPEQERGDGWSPFARKLFLQVLAETGKVTTACEYTHLSGRSAYDLRNRDPLFAAGWDAACHLARNPLADTLREQSVDGVTDTITRNGEIVAERHRYDMRLSMAVLARLDKRCDRAEELGSKHVALVRNWDEWLNLVGKGDEAAARTLLETGMSETAQHCADCEVPESENPTAPLNPPGWDPSENCWRAGSADDLNPTRGRGVAEGAWITVYPPPPGFDGYQNVEWDGDTWYERACTEEEAELLDAHEAAKAAAEQAEIEAEAAKLLACSEAERDSWFEKLRSELGANRHAEVVSASIADPGADGDGTGAGESP